MGAALKKMKPEELVSFKKMPTDIVSEIQIPERAENRRPTDKRFIIVFIVAVVILIPFLIYTLVYADIGRTSFRYDPCGNICGKKNDRYDEWTCTGEDFTEKPFLQFTEDFDSLRFHDVRAVLLAPRKCVKSCDPGYITLRGLKMCVPGSEYSYPYSRKNTFDVSSDQADDDVYSEHTETVGEYLSKLSWRITFACLLSLGVTLGTLYLLRSATVAMVWSILVCFITLIVIFTCLLWYAYFNTGEDFGRSFIVLPIFMTVLLLIVTCVMAFLFRKIKLVIALIKEAMKAAFAMPQLLLIPILTSIAETIIVVLFLTTATYLRTSGILTEIEEGFLEYQSNFAMVFTQVLNFALALWSLQLVVGIQYMVIAGAVAKWYFAKDKNYLESPILTSARITFKFHIGSICFGSLIITVITLIRALLSSLLKNKCLEIIVKECMSGIEQFLKYLSKNAYIMTAMHGKPFYKSGKRAAKILFQNALNVVAINFIGDFILVLAQLTIVGISLLFTYVIMQSADQKYANYVYFIVFIVSLCIAATFFAIFETVIDTIFLCFCEDTLLNDGLSRPFAMSTNMMQFVDNAKKVFVNKKK